MDDRNQKSNTPLPSDKAKLDITDHLIASVQDLPEGPVTFEQIVNLLGRRSFGLAILIFSIAMLLPMPPGIPAVAGFVIVVFAVQLIIDRNHLWLPLWIGRKTIDREVLISAYTFVKRYLGWMFRLARPRLPNFTGPLARRISGVLFATLGLLMILPIPFIGNIFPAFACTVLALGLTDRDGVIYMIGIIVSGLAILTTALMGIGAINIIGAAF